MLLVCCAITISCSPMKLTFLVPPASYRHKRHFLRSPTCMGTSLRSPLESLLLRNQHSPGLSPNGTAHSLLCATWVSYPPLPGLRHGCHRPHSSYTASPRLDCLLPASYRGSSSPADLAITSIANPFRHAMLIATILIYISSLSNRDSFLTDTPQVLLAGVRHPTSDRHKVHIIHKL